MAARTAFAVLLAGPALAAKPGEARSADVPHARRAAPTIGGRAAGVSASSAAAVAVSTSAASEVSVVERRRSLLLADILINDGRFEEAEAFAWERLDRDPEQAPWILRLAQICAAQGRSRTGTSMSRRC